jgi:hypothetical protein
MKKIVEFRFRIVSLEADLKVPVPTSCSTCELHVVKNFELRQCVDRLQTENDDLRNLLSWLSSQEPQLGMMIEAFKCFDGQAFGSDKVGECSGKRKWKFGKTLVSPHTTPMNQVAPSQTRRISREKNQVRSRVCKATRMRRNHNQHPKKNLFASIVSIMVGMVIRESFASGGERRRGLLG